MKHAKTLVLATALLLMLGCRKNDLKAPITENNSNIIAKPVTGINESEWQGSDKWSGVEQSQFSIYYTNLKAGAITADAAEKGMVKVFKISSGKATESKTLPFEETIGSEKYYWYYQVTEGNIMISVDVYGSKTNPAEKSLFKYVILSNDVVDGLEKKGTSKSDLMRMNYDKITEATKN